MMQLYPNLRAGDARQRPNAYPDSSGRDDRRPRELVRKQKGAGPMTRPLKESILQIPIA